MKDTIIKGTGNSRYLKSVANFKSLYPTYDAFATALVNGTLPIDLNGINADGLTQAGTDLTKANLLSDTTKSAIGLTQADPTIDNALAAMVLPLTMHKEISNASSLSSSGLATGDYIGLSDTSAGTGKKVTLTNLATYLATLSGFTGTFGKVATGSYTGTGTYGSSNPNSITFPFTPKLVWIYGDISNPTETNMRSIGVYAPMVNINNSTRLIIDFGDLSTSYTNGSGFVYGSNTTSNIDGAYAKKSGNTLSWYHTSNSLAQINGSIHRYKWIAFG